MTLRYFNTSAEKLVGSVDRDHFPAEAAATIYAQDESVMAGGKPLKEELSVGDDPATRMVFLDTKQALRDGSGEITAVVGIATDITETVRLRDELNVALGRLEAELETARQLQFGMLSNRLLLVSEPQPVDIHALMEPAREIGGDLYDVFYTDDGLLCMVIGDVCGKGAAAGMFMARTLSLVRMAVTELRPQLGAATGSPRPHPGHRQPPALPAQRRLHVRDAVSRVPGSAHGRIDVFECRSSLALPSDARKGYCHARGRQVAAPGRAR